MNTIRCPQCNLTNWATAISCKRCGNLFQNIEPNSPENASVVNQFPVTNFGANSQDSSPNSYSNNYYQPQNNYSNYRQNNANQKSGLAITSMVLGIVGSVLGCFGGFLLSPIGLIFGIVSLVKANKRPQEYGGKGFAIAGTVLNSLLVLSFPIILAIAIPNLLAARRAANEGSAISSIRTLVAAEQTFMATGGAGKCGDLSQLGKTGLIDQVLSSGIKSGYKFTIVTTPFGCEIHATPAVTEGVSATGIRSFYSTNEDNWEIHYAVKKGLMADKNDPILERFNSPSQNYLPRIASQK